MKKKWVQQKKQLIAFAKRISLFLLVFTAGGIVSGFYFQHQSQSYVLISGYPLLKQKGYTAVYDGRSKGPLWTHEHLTSKELFVHAKREGMHFYENSKIYPLHRSTLSDYYRSGYDRGHMVPCRDQQFSLETLKETFLLSNVCPQDPNLNQGYWLKLEHYVRELVLKNESVDVISGPLYLPKVENGKKFVTYEVIGENNVSVPTHFYKIIKINLGKGDFQVVAFLIPNAPIAPDVAFETYQVSLEEIEKSSGLIFELTKKTKKSSFAQLEESF